VPLTERKRFKRGFRRSYRGNLWRRYRGFAVTVFKREADGYYAWCCSQRGEARWSRDRYPDEEAALEAVWQEV
jgi:hypothetical protein